MIQSTAAASSTRDEQSHNRDAAREFSIASWSQLRKLSGSRFCMRSFNKRGFPLLLALA
jgi:hypothetical protein